MIFQKKKRFAAQEIFLIINVEKVRSLRSGQVYFYSAFCNIDCIKADSQYQSKHNNNVHFLVEKQQRLLELI